MIQISLAGDEALGFRRATCLLPQHAPSAAISRAYAAAMETRPELDRRSAYGARRFVQTIFWSVLMCGCFGRMCPSKLHFSELARRVMTLGIRPYSFHVGGHFNVYRQPNRQFVFRKSLCRR